jgi:hypothetical protein
MVVHGENMLKEDNDWELENLGGFGDNNYRVTINETTFLMSDNFAGLTHAILLLVDAINDKPISKE